MNKTLILISVFVGLIISEAAAVVQVPANRGIACKLCKDFVRDLETELENDEGTIEQVRPFFWDFLGLFERNFFTLNSVAV